MISETPLNREVLSELRELLAENFNELIDRYLLDSKTRFAILERAIASSDFKTIQYEAHGIKGSSRNMGANQLASIMDKIEHLGQDSQPQDVAALLAHAQAEYARVVSDLAQFRAD